MQVNKRRSQKSNLPIKNAIMLVTHFNALDTAKELC